MVNVQEWIEVARASDIAPNTGLRVEIDDFPVAIWNVDGEFYATADTCSHEEASLSDGDVWDGRIECPMHGAQFDPATGEALSLPAIMPIATFPMKIENDAVLIGWSAE